MLCSVVKNRSKTSGSVESSVANKNIRMDLLRTRLLEWVLAPEEFFRTVSRMVYASDEFYHMVRTQAVERVQDHPEDYQFLFLDQYDSPEDYISQMGTDRHLADNAIIRATADALQIEIHIISSDFSKVFLFFYFFIFV